MKEPKFYSVATGWTTALDLTSGQETPIGEIVGHLYYSNHCLLDMVKHDGYPHNGGSHSLTIYGEKKDLIAWLEMVAEFYFQSKFAKRFGLGAEELQLLKNKLA